MPADPQPVSAPRRPTRLVDRTATLRACLTYRECPCGLPSATGHHVLAKTAGGDDVLENIVPLCGSGTTGCHGAVENEEAAALARLGLHIASRRPDVCLYLLEKLGEETARDWLLRRLSATMPR